ncbi:uncharacterized protein LOC111831565 [Capsella rubella]|uniref:uncharacterized protein LOC111831565 n=1 Tax=Capsella rubella TaxID=81985 RepID=UPI000CD5AF1D|nr:uncharacterized protein LOC111831565 [Capsella rubella]
MANETTARCVFISTNKDTNLGLLLDCDDSVFAFKGKIKKQHEQCFPSFGRVSVVSIKVNMGGKFYYLPDSMVLSKAIDGIRNKDWSLFADVEANGKEILTITAPSSNPNPDLKTKVAKENTNKRKERSSAGDKKSHRKVAKALGNETSVKRVDLEKDVTNVIAPTFEVKDDVNETRKAFPANYFEASSSGGGKQSSEDHIDQSLVAEDEALKGGDAVAVSEPIPNSSGEKITNTLVLLAVPKENEMGTKDNGAGDATKSVKAAPKKSRSKKDKAPVKEEPGVGSSAGNVEQPGSDSQENAEKVAKKSRKKASSKAVEEA